MQTSDYLHIEKSLEEIRKYLEAIETDEPYSRFHLTGSGPVRELEEKFRKYYQCAYALSFSSATNALTSIAISLDLNDDEIIAAPYSWGSSVAGLIELTSAEISWANPDEYLNISPQSVKELITNRTKAVWACDYDGIPHDMYSLRKVCDENNLIYISDAAQSFGKQIRGLPASSLSDVWVVSFGAGKFLDSGEGAIVLTNSKTWYSQLLRFQHPYRMMKDISLESDDEFYPINGRISPMSAIVINNKLNHLYPELS